MTEYARKEHHDFIPASRAALADPPLQAALIRLTGTLMAANRRGYAALPGSDQLRDHAKRIKEYTLAHLDKYLEQLEASVQRVGGHVHWAVDAVAARKVVKEIAQRSEAKRVVKSKSMTSEEIHLNHALQEAGIEVTETDFGEYIIQLAGERPSHLVAPAVLVVAVLYTTANAILDSGRRIQLSPLTAHRRRRQVVGRPRAALRPRRRPPAKR